MVNCEEFSQYYASAFAVSSDRPARINRPHDFFRPAHTICDCAHRCGDPRSAIVLRQLSRSENRGSNQQHTLAAFVHFLNVHLSLYLRQQEPVRGTHYNSC